MVADALVDRIQDDVVYLRLATRIRLTKRNTIALVALAVAPEIARVSVEVGLPPEFVRPAGPEVMRAVCG